MTHNDLDHSEAERQRLLQSLPIISLNENILPLPGGRRAQTLNQFNRPDSDEDQLLIERTRTAFEKELAELNDVEDPLEVYVRYLQWITDTFPTGDNKESQLFVALQKTCYDLQDDIRYTSDLRYLKCWLRLSKFMDDPMDIYNLLKQKGIGQNWALFYEEYSKVYEERQRYEEARSVLEKGVERRVQPLSRLQQLLNQLIARIEHTRPSPSTHLPTSRTVLGVKVDPKLRESMSQATYDHLQNTSSGIRGLSSGLRRPTPSPQQPQSKPRKFLVASDNTDLPASSLTDRIFPPTSPSKAPKVSLSRLARHPVENMPNVEKPGESTMPMDSAYIRPAKFQINICKDNDDNDSRSPSHQQSSSSPTTIRRHPNQPSDIFEARYHRSKHLFIHTHDSKGTPEIIAALKECLGGPGPMNPISFEELRILRQVDRRGRPQHINGKAPNRITLTDDEESIPCRIGRGRSPTMEYTAETLAAMKAVSAIFDKGNDLDSNDDEQQPKRRKQTFVNEND